MTESLFVGVDGGATKCVVRLEDAAGNLLGRAVGGPANVNLSVTKTAETIFSTLESIIKPLGMTLADGRYRWHAGMGLAGCEVLQDYHQFLSLAHPFETLKISSDAHVACLGAHRGEDGAIIIIGTGSIGFQLQGGRVTKISGWGFPHDDAGSGAWLGMQAVKITLQAMDGRQPASGLSAAIMAHFRDDLNMLVAFANKANSTAFASLAPLIVAQCQTGDMSAKRLLQEAALAIEQIAEALERANPDNADLPCALVGGLAAYLEPFMSRPLRERLVPCALTPDEGAIFLVRQNDKT